MAMTESHGTPRGPYAKTAAVRGRVLAAAWVLFAETGYRAATMKEIAARAGISERGLVHHFASKEEVLAGVLAGYDSHVGGLLPKGSGMPALRQLVDVIASDMSSNHVVELYAILSAEAADPSHPGHEYYARRYVTFRQYAAQQFATFLSAQPLGSAGVADPEEFAVAFTALMDGLQTQWLYDRGTTIDAAAVLHRFLDMREREVLHRQNASLSADD